MQYFIESWFFLNFLYNYLENLDKYFVYFCIFLNSLEVISVTVSKLGCKNYGMPVSWTLSRPSIWASYEGVFLANDKCLVINVCGLHISHYCLYAWYVIGIIILLVLPQFPGPLGIPLHCIVLTKCTYLLVMIFPKENSYFNVSM